MRCHEKDFQANAIFHIYNRSIQEANLFQETSDYYYFLSKLQKSYRPEKMDIFAYCLMPNHFHFCIQQKAQTPIYEIFSHFLTAYVLHYNHKYHRYEKLFAKKLQHKLIADETYLLEVCRYIHRNPIRAKLTNNCSKWKFSNFQEWIGKRKGILFDPQILKTLNMNASTYEKYCTELDDDPVVAYLYSKSKT